MERSKKCIDPEAGDADLWEKGILVEVENVKAHRTKNDKNEKSHFEKFFADGNEKADELAKEGAMLDEGFMAETRAKTVEQERDEVYAALQHAACLLCLVREWKDCEELKPKPKDKWIFVDKKKRKRNIERSGLLRPTNIVA